MTFVMGDKLPPELTPKPYPYKGPAPRDAAKKTAPPPTETVKATPIPSTTTTTSQKSPVSLTREEPRPSKMITVWMFATTVAVGLMFLLDLTSPSDGSGASPIATTFPSPQVSAVPTAPSARMEMSPRHLTMVAGMEATVASLALVVQEERYGRLRDIDNMATKIAALNYTVSFEAGMSRRRDESLGWVEPPPVRDSPSSGYGMHFPYPAPTPTATPHAVPIPELNVGQ